MRRTALFLASALGVGPALAQASDPPWYLGASLGLTRVDNIYRVDDGSTPAQDDDLRTASLLTGGRLLLGRQRLRADLRATQNVYRRNSDLDYLGYSGSTALDWVVGSRLSGRVSLSGQRSLAPFNPGNAPVTTEKNIETNKSARLSVRYGLTGIWAIDGGISANRRNFSIALYDRYDYSQQASDIGLRWQPQPDLALRIAGRHANGRYPRFRLQADGSYLADRYRRNEVDAQIEWQPGVDHRLALRLSEGRSRYSEALARDTKGVTGRLDWNWTPSSRIQLQLVLSRDTGDDTRSVDLGQFGRFDSVNSRQTDSLQLLMAYALSAKLSLDLSHSQFRRELVDSFGSNSVRGKDRSQASGLGLRWAFSRQGQFGCQWNADRRDGAAAFSIPYKASSVGCSLQYQVSG